MSFPLRDFESAVPRDIARKGLDYFAGDQVDNLAQDGNDWAADVYGTDTYLVEVTIDDGVVTGWSCDCPYDWGPLCKHVAAVLYAIRDEWPEEEEEEAAPPPPKRRRRKPKEAAKPAPKKREKDQTPVDPVEEIIARLEVEELRQLLGYFARRENEVRVHLLAKYTHLLKATSRDQYRKLVRSIIDAHSDGRYGLIGYREANALGDRLYRLLEDSGGDVLSTIYLCEEIITQLADAIAGADDPGGSMGGAMGAAIGRLQDLAASDSEMPAGALDELYRFSLDHAGKEVFDGLDAGYDLRRLATLAVRDKHQAQELIAAIDRYIARKSQEKYGEYDVEDAFLRKWELLAIWWGAAEAEAFLQDHLHFSRFRKIALEKALEEKRYAEVRRLAEEGIVLDTEKRYPGLVAEWKRWLMRLAENTGDQATLAELSEKMFLESRDMTYFRRLKQLLPAPAFARKVDACLRHFRKQTPTRWGPVFNEIVAQILEEEQRLSELMTLLEEAPSLDLLDQYAALLAEEYRQRYVGLYEQCLRTRMEQVNDRSAYRYCCSYLDKIEKLSNRDTAARIAADWRVAYPRRRAMLEELEMAGW